LNISWNIKNQSCRRHNMERC